VITLGSGLGSRAGRLFGVPALLRAGVLDLKLLLGLIANVRCLDGSRRILVAVAVKSVVVGVHLERRR
jgi:hypothetical protein